MEDRLPEFESDIQAINSLVNDPDLSYACGLAKNRLELPLSSVLRIAKEAYEMYLSIECSEPERAEFLFHLSSGNFGIASSYIMKLASNRIKQPQRPTRIVFKTDSIDIKPQYIYYTQQDQMHDSRAFKQEAESSDESGDDSINSQSGSNSESSEDREMSDESEQKWSESSHGLSRDLGYDGNMHSEDYKLESSKEEENERNEKEEENAYQYEYQKTQEKMQFYKPGQTGLVSNTMNMPGLYTYTQNSSPLHTNQLGSLPNPQNQTESVSNTRYQPGYFSNPQNQPGPLQNLSYQLGSLPNPQNQTESVSNTRYQPGYLSNPQNQPEPLQNLSYRLGSLPNPQNQPEPLQNLSYQLGSLPNPQNQQGYRQSPESYSVKSTYQHFSQLQNASSRPQDHQLNQHILPQNPQSQPLSQDYRQTDSYQPYSQPPQNALSSFQNQPDNSFNPRPYNPDQSYNSYSDLSKLPVSNYNPQVLLQPYNSLSNPPQELPKPTHQSNSISMDIEKPVQNQYSTASFQDLNLIPSYQYPLYKQSVDTSKPMSIENPSSSPFHPLPSYSSEETKEQRPDTSKLSSDIYSFSSHGNTPPQKAVTSTPSPLLNFALNSPLQTPFSPPESNISDPYTFYPSSQSQNPPCPEINQMKPSGNLIYESNIKLEDAFQEVESNPDLNESYTILPENQIECFQGVKLEDSIHLNTENMQSESDPNLQKEVKLQTKAYEPSIRNMGEIWNHICYLCRTSLQSSENVLLQNCGHRFHKSCFDSKFVDPNNQSYLCPIDNCSKPIYITSFSDIIEDQVIQDLLENEILICPSLRCGITLIRPTNKPFIICEDCKNPICLSCNKIHPDWYSCKHNLQI